jgi:hypothetical protein
MGPILYMVAISHDVEGMSCEEFGRCVNSCLLCLFTAPAKASCFASPVATPWGYKASGRPYVQPMSSHIISNHLPASFPMAEKNVIEKQI